MCVLQFILWSCATCQGSLLEMISMESAKRQLPSPLLESPTQTFLWFRHALAIPSSATGKLGKVTVVNLLPQKKDAEVTYTWALMLRASFNYANLRMCNAFGLEYSSIIRNIRKQLEFMSLLSLSGTRRKRSRVR